MKDIYIGDIGKGTPLVLIHGFLCSSRMWELQINTNGVPLPVSPIYISFIFNFF